MYWVTVSRGVGVVDTTEQGAEFGELVLVEAVAAAEHHVFQGVRGAGKAVRRVVRPDEVVQLGGDHGCQAVRHDDDAKTVGQRRAQDGVLRRSGFDRGGLVSGHQGQGEGPRDNALFQAVSPAG